MRHIMKIAVISLILLITACGGGSGESDTSGNACGDLNLRVANGDSCSLSNTPVVLITAVLPDGRKARCTGTLVTNNDVLTAAHCLPPGIVDLVVQDENKGYRIVNAAIHPNYVPVEQGIPIYDFAMLTLDSVSSASPVPLLVSDPVIKGEQFSAYGYGVDEAGNAIEDRDISDFLKAAYMSVDVVNSVGFSGSFASSGATVCSGDSGGPVIQVVDGVASIVGVSSFLFLPGGQCSDSFAAVFGNLQNPEAYEFITNYAPDVVIR